MPNQTYQTDERLKSYLDTNQLHREQMCRAILATDKRFSEVRPRHPRGGPDGGRDIEAIFREGEVACGAVGFMNQANDSSDHKRAVFAKFSADLSSAQSAKNDLCAFVFLTNVNLTIGEKDRLVEEAKSIGISYCEIFDRERLRIVLDGPDGFSIRFQYLGIALSEAEQATFFARWGDEIQSVISTGFEKVQTSLNRLMFLQEVGNPLAYLSLHFELDKEYSAEEIGHFRLFCSLHLKEPKHRILAVLFGSSDKSNRMRSDLGNGPSEQPPGIKYGVSGGQWELHVALDEGHKDDRLSVEETDRESAEEDEEAYVCTGCSSSIGIDPVQFIGISYGKDPLIRLAPGLTLRDMDESMFLPFCNESLATKIKAIHIYSNGYKLQEISTEGFSIDCDSFETREPAVFSEEELEDRWVRIRPAEISSAFHLRFFESTPVRLYEPKPVQNSLP